MVEMICDKGLELSDVDAELAKHGYPPMNSRSYDIVKNTYCPVIKNDPKKRTELIEKPMPMGDL